MLGDTVQSALFLIGITQERVERWLGAPCNCPERIQKLNQLGAWAIRVVTGKREKAEMYLNQILEQENV